MNRIHPLVIVAILLGLLACAARAVELPRTAQPDPRLDKKTLAADQATVDRAIAELKDLDPAKRELAAATLRRLVAKYPSHTVYLASDDGGRAVWQKKLGQVKLGMTKAEVLKIAPYFQDKGAAAGGSGGNFFESYRLDYQWSMTIVYTGFTGDFRDTSQAKVIELPELHENVEEIFVVPAPPIPAPGSPGMSRAKRRPKPITSLANRTVFGRPIGATARRLRSSTGTRGNCTDP